MHNLILFGGTFDPIHYGHLYIARAIQNFFHFERFIFLPCKIQVLKNNSVASTAQRIDMLKIALANQSDFSIDLREIERDTPSYMVETLQCFRKEYPHDAITLLLGMDAFMQLPQWYHWQKLIKLANLLVIKRVGINGQQISEKLKTLLLKHETHCHHELLTSAYGKIYCYDAGQYDISSSKVRQQIKQGLLLESYLPHAIADYIRKNGIYK